MSLSESGFLDWGSGRLHYLKMGHGKRLLVAFHGYGNSAALFSPFKDYLKEDFTIVSFDLPFHGKSKWEKGVLLHKKDLVVIAQKLMKEFQVERLSLMGYSIGGRVCLNLMELMPKQIESVLLIAPDGLIRHPLYYLVTKTSVGKQLFERTLTKPDKLLAFISWLQQRKWMNQSKLRFIMYSLGSREGREFLLDVWPAMSLLIADRKELRKTVKEHKIPVFIFMGFFDRIIPLRHAQRFKKGLETVKLFILEKGHRMFDEDSLPVMTECLRMQKLKNAKCKTGKY